MAVSVSLKKLAEILGLAPSTVSRALKGHPDISRATQERVRALAQELHYKPSALALSLRNKRSNSIAMLVPFLGNYFYACAVSSVIRSAYSSGYKVIVFENGEDYEQEVKICQFLQKSGIDGLVVAPARTTNDLDHFVKLQHEGIPMVFFDRIAPNLDKDRHLFTDEKLIVECEDVSEVYRITRQLVLHSGVDGIFAANDAFAVHVLSVLRQMKCRVPEEVAVCGYGNEPSTEVTFPALTTVNKDGYRVGNIAAGLLIRRIEDKEEVPTVTRLLKPELIVRDSTLSVDR